MQSVASPPRRVPSGLNTCDLVNRKPMAKCPSERREDIRNSITRVNAINEGREVLTSVRLREEQGAD